MFAEIKLPWIFHYVLHMLKDIETLAKTPPDSQYYFECWVICFASEFVFHSVFLWNRYRQKLVERFTREISIGQVATDAVQQLFGKVLDFCVRCNLLFCCSTVTTVHGKWNRTFEPAWKSLCWAKLWCNTAIHFGIPNIFLWGKTLSVSEKFESRSAGHSL